MSVLSGFGRSRTVSLRPSASEFPLGRLSFDTDTPDKVKKVYNTDIKDKNQRPRNTSFDVVLH